MPGSSLIVAGLSVKVIAIAQWRCYSDNLHFSVTKEEALFNKINLPELSEDQSLYLTNQIHLIPKEFSIFTNMTVKKQVAHIEAISSATSEALQGGGWLTS